MTVHTEEENGTIVRFTMTRPDDWHVHVRDNEQMGAVLGYTAAQFARAIIMPNLKPPIRTVWEAIDYRERIYSACKEQHLTFKPLMTLYLTDNTAAQDIRAAAESECVYACKLYPAGATTNSAAGVSDIRKIYPLLEAMEKFDLPLLIHGEVTDPEVDIFDREKRFINTILCSIRMHFPNLRIVLEHITTEEGVNCVELWGSLGSVAATITAHHLLINRNALFQGGLRPHNYCLPVAKREKHRLALVKAATSGNPNFFLGTDSAPHAKGAKESACGCAGCFTAPIALPLYAQAFEESGHANWIERLEQFASHNGADFYGLPRNATTVTLAREGWRVPEFLPFGKNSTITPFYASETLHWKVVV
ncbi:MAG: dihydroorotase [Candidatus Moranbacteria bacterium]|nr:dihydroorotase [Candidatus Moranbacteria bacterium]